jgi:hypothetical protein
MASPAVVTFNDIQLILQNNLGNGVTVAYRVLGLAVEIPEMVLQLSPFLVRLFPGTSEPFAKLPAGAHDRPSIDKRQSRLRRSGRMK